VTNSRPAESRNASRATGVEQSPVHAHILITLLELLPRLTALREAAVLATAMVEAGKVRDSRATVVLLGIRWSVTAYSDRICCLFLLGTVWGFVEREVDIQCLGYKLFLALVRDLFSSLHCTRVFRSGIRLARAQ
jgi:hypothetical protein